MHLQARLSQCSDSIGFPRGSVCGIPVHKPSQSYQQGIQRCCKDANVTYANPDGTTTSPDQACKAFCSYPDYGGNQTSLEAATASNAFFDCIRSIDEGKYVSGGICVSSGSATSTSNQTSPPAAEPTGTAGHRLSVSRLAVGAIAFALPLATLAITL